MPPSAVARSVPAATEAVGSSSPSRHTKPWKGATVSAVSAPFETIASTTPSTSSRMMNGLVHWTSRTTSTGEPCSASWVSMACRTAASEVAVSPAMAAGRSTTSAPAWRAAAAMAWSSVETTTSVTRRAARHSRTARATSGTPPTGRRFLAGTPLEPPRAGITASTRRTGAAWPASELVMRCSP